MVHLLIGSTCNISGLMTKCSEVYGELQNVQEQSLEFARLEKTFLVHRLVTLIVYDYSFDHTSKIFYIILIVIIV